jgi:hypothetical protein
MPPKQYTFFYRNGLSIALLVMMLIFWSGQVLTGFKDNNTDRQQYHYRPLTMGEYLTSGHFFSATFENWESEFLQMSVYVLMTISLRQRGSAESKKLDDKEDVDRVPVARAGSPWPVRKGGIWLIVYQNSLSLAFAFLFLLSFWLHFAGSYKEYNLQQTMMHQPRISAGAYLHNAHFWFESFQNWQSEFLAVLSIVVLSIWLRQKGSPESKPVDAPHTQTGD